MGRQAKQPWYVLFQAVRARINAYQGTESINLLIRQLAREAGYDAKVVSRMLKAGNFLDSLAPTLAPEQVTCGYAHIELLERLHQLDADAATSMLSATLANQHTLHTLREAITHYANVAGTPATTARSKARSRVANHERVASAAILEAGADFFDFPGGEIIKVTHSDFFSQFFMIQVNGLQKAAIFIRVGDTSRKQEKAAADLLKLASMARAYFEKIWFVFPEPSGVVHELAYHAHAINAFDNWVSLATVNEEDQTLERFWNLGHAFTEELFGGSPLKWEGFAVQDRAKKKGEFLPVLKT
ncbi:hypothetical protein [Pseudomonas sp. NMI4491_12]|uniref:hypothetical protein n=1 Tax=Pseudomonas sp. NMI4491_12 TaxID=2903146 RepID=UPI001E44682F|nr:hypothetical protein [Pseudomonas sp. NMI4491_12]MCE0966724.1 hypothetical protein [Pseudomonas sp. NMI4491_12]